ncbi:hypothetical protein L0337_15235 [candidate division KSB1 bacterium]|nr:hypothetical protein [candidate division KSB1 bacterium]
MNGSGKKLLAGAGFAADQYRHLAWRNLLHFGKRLTKFRLPANQFLQTQLDDQAVDHVASFVGGMITKFLHLNLPFPEMLKY